MKPRLILDRSGAAIFNGRIPGSHPGQTGGRDVQGRAQACLSSLVKVGPCPLPLTPSGESIGGMDSSWKQELSIAIVVWSRMPIQIVVQIVAIY